MNQKRSYKTYNKNDNRRSHPRGARPSRSYGSSDKFSSVLGHLHTPRVLMIASTLVLIVLGLLMVFSASSITSIAESGSAFTVVTKQLPYAILGTLLCIAIVLFIPYKEWTRVIGYAFAALCALGLVATAVAGTAALGAQRWLVLGPVSLQPSEFAKIAFILIGSKIFDQYQMGEIDSRTLIYKAVGFLLIPLGFLYITQSDLGTTGIICVGLLAVLWLGEASQKIILRIIGVMALFALLSVVFTSYRSSRMAFLNPWDDASGAGYQLIHSFFAFSEGGIFGAGLGNSHEKFQYLPEAQTDFVFSILGEELGLVVTTLVVILFLVFLYAGLKIAHDAPDGFGRMIAGSLTTMIVFQAFLNMACVLGLAPTTGKPLPFLSAGGSSMLSSLMMVGIILSVSYGSHKPEPKRPTNYNKRRDNLRVVRRVSDSEVERKKVGQRDFPKAPRSRFESARIMQTQNRSRKKNPNENRHENKRASYYDRRPPIRRK